MKPNTAYLAFNIIGISLSVIPPLLATVSYFPVFLEKGSGATVSGVALLLILLSALPIFKLLRRLLDSPSARTVWIITFIAFFTLGKIADEMTVISFVGAISNLIGSVFFALARRRKDDEGKA